MSLILSSFAINNFECPYIFIFDVSIYSGSEVSYRIVYP